MNSEEEILHSPQKDAVDHSMLNSDAGSPILHSYKRDRMSAAKLTIGGSTNNVTDEEVQILADYSARAKRRAQNRFLFTVGLLLVIVACIIFIIPYIFPNTKTVYTNPNNVLQNYSSFFTADVVYTASLPKTKNDFITLGKKTILQKESTARIVFLNNSVEMNTIETLSSVSHRFNTLSQIVDSHFIYGAIINPDSKKEEKFLILKTNKSDQVSAELRNLERTMNSDLGPLLSIENTIPNDNLDTRAFVDSQSIKSPARILERSDRSIALIYGFVDNTYVVFTTSHTSFELLKNKLLAGY